MFCSVQLNVNNPHFLIMQGRITKVLNMKPPEVCVIGGDSYLAFILISSSSYLSSMPCILHSIDNESCLPDSIHG